jgi:DtxR family Mn-dependent transcriptional regulator
MNAAARALGAAGEDYLEAILHLSGEGGVARVRDIAAEVGVTLSTVSRALKGLAARGLVNYRPYEVITLTPEGREIAQRISRRHDLLARFLADVLGVDRETAEADACRIEHDLSREAAARLAALMGVLEASPQFREQLKARVERTRRRTRPAPGKKRAR